MIKRQTATEAIRAYQDIIKWGKNQQIRHEKLFREILTIILSEIQK